MLSMEDKGQIREEVMLAMQEAMKPIQQQMRTFFTFAGLLVVVMIAFIGIATSTSYRNTDKIQQHDKKIEKNIDHILYMTRIIATEHPQNAFVIDLLKDVSPQRGKESMR